MQVSDMLVVRGTAGNNVRKLCEFVRRQGHNIDLSYNIRPGSASVNELQSKVRQIISNAT